MPENCKSLLAAKECITVCLIHSLDKLRLISDLNSCLDMATFCTERPESIASLGVICSIISDYLQDIEGHLSRCMDAALVIQDRVTGPPGADGDRTTGDSTRGDPQTIPPPSPRV